MSELDDLRKLIRAREKAAARKIRRIEGDGVWLTGGEFDPRRPDAPVNRYNRRQLNNYLAKLNGFVSRKNQYVPDTWGRPIPRAEFRAAQRAVAKRNARADKLGKEYGGIVGPDGLTLAQRDAAMVNHDFPKTANAAVNSPLHKHPPLVPKQIGSRKALAAWAKRQQKMVEPQWFDKLVKAGRQDARKMLAEIGDKKTQQQLNKLSDKQFHALWGYTEFATIVSRRYERQKENANDRASREIEAGDVRDTDEWIKWAQGVGPKRAEQEKFAGNNDTRARSNPIVQQNGDNIVTRRMADGDEEIISVNGQIKSYKGVKNPRKR